jgi:hypothetical protein
MMTTENSISRVAGLVYLMVVVAGTFSLVWVPGKIGGAPGIVAQAGLYRWGMAGFVVMQVAFLLLPFVLFRLFRSVNESVAVLMVALAVVSVPIGLTGLTHKMQALSLLTNPEYAQWMKPEQLQASVKASLQAYSHCIHMAGLFWGLWLLPFGYLVYRSDFLPRVLGVLLMLGCGGYMVNVFGKLLLAGYADMGLATYASLPASLGEIGTCLWLVLAGARRKT